MATVAMSVCIFNRGSAPGEINSIARDGLSRLVAGGVAPLDGSNGAIIRERRDAPDVSEATVLQADPGVNFTVFAIGKSDFGPFSTRADLAFC